MTYRDYYIKPENEALCTNRCTTTNATAGIDATLFISLSALATVFTIVTTVIATGVFGGPLC